MDRRTSTCHPQYLTFLLSGGKGRPNRTEFETILARTGYNRITDDPIGPDSVRSLFKPFSDQLNHKAIMAPILLLGCLLSFQTDEFSGPQKGELLPDCEVKVIIGPDQGKKIKLHESVKDGPNVLLFVHQVTRPAFGLTRTVVNYAKTRAKDGVVVTVVFLTADPTDIENWMNRAKGALPKGINLGISMDGIEGPGAFGLNRKMQLTTLVSKEKKVTANFAIIQPSIQADAVKICHEIARTLGDQKMPTAKELGINAPQRMARGGNKSGGNGGVDDGTFRQLISPLIQKTATDEDVEKQAKVIADAASKNPALRKRIFDVANRIIDAGKLENYGTKKAQGFLTKWAKEFGDEKKESRKPDQD